MEGLWNCGRLASFGRPAGCGALATLPGGASSTGGVCISGVASDKLDGFSDLIDKLDPPFLHTINI